MASISLIVETNFPDGRDNTFNHKHVYGTVSIAAGTYPAHGITLLWVGSGIPSPTPSWVQFESMGSPPGVFFYVWDRASETIRIMGASGITTAGSAPFVEIATGSAVPAQVVADTIGFSAMFDRSAA